MARERFKEGVSYFDQKQYDKARAAFLQAYALKKHPAVLLNLAQSELRSGHEADAAKHFSAYLRESKDAGDAEKSAAEAGLTAAKVVVAEVNVSVDERAAEVYVDGILEANSPLPGALYLTPGTHSIEARKDGKTASAQVNASAGKQLDASLQFGEKPASKPASVEAAAPEPSSEAPPAHSGGRKPFFSWLFHSPVGLVGTGLTVVGGGGGVAAALISKADYNNADSVASQITRTATLDGPKLGTGSLCADPKAWLIKAGYSMDPTAVPTFTHRVNEYTSACSKYQTNVHNGDTMKTLATVGFVVAGVSAVGTVLYYFVDPNAKEAHEEARASGLRVSVVPTVAPGQSGLTLVGSF